MAVAGQGRGVRHLVRLLAAGATAVACVVCMWLVVPAPELSESQGIRWGVAAVLAVFIAGVAYALVKPWLAERPPSEGSRLEMVVTGAVVLAVAVLLIVKPGSRDSEEPPAGGGTAGDRSEGTSGGHGSGGESSGGGDTGSGDSPGSTEKECRDEGYAPASDGVEILPCIAPTADGFAVSATVRPMSPDRVPDEVTVWVWLSEYNPELEAMKRMDEARDESAVTRCSISFDSGDQTCTANFPPWKGEGKYVTNADVRLFGDDLPPRWDEPDFSGFQSPSSTWPP